MTAARVFCAFMLAGVTFVSGAWVGRMDERAKWQHSNSDRDTPDHWEDAMNANLEAALRRGENRHGAKWNPASLLECDETIQSAYGSGQRVRVVTTYANGETYTRTGTVSMTTGWMPAFLLMHRANALGSCDLLRAGDRVVARQRGREYVPTRDDSMKVAVSYSGRAGKIYHDGYRYQRDWITGAERGCTNYAELVDEDEAIAQGYRPCKRCLSKPSRIER